MQKIQKIIVFFQEVRSELKKVSWPSKKDVVGATTVVIITTLIMGLFLGIIDLVLSKGIELLLHK
jgi:preprotein translocase subunit SecE